MAVTPLSLSQHLYERICGRELEANLLHFQYVPQRYARRDIRRDGPRLEGWVLDVGCGNQPFRPYLTRARRYVGLDLPPTSRSLRYQAPPEVYGDGHHLPFKDASFDAVLCTQVLEHAARPAELLRELARVLKPGGLGLISVPFFYNLHLEPHDYFRFTPYGLGWLLENNGLRIQELRGQGGIGSLLVQMLHNWLFSGLKRWSRKGRWRSWLLVPAMPFLFCLTLLDNLVALALDRLNAGDLRFSPNLWVLVTKKAT